MSLQYLQFCLVTVHLDESAALTAETFEFYRDANLNPCVAYGLNKSRIG